MKSFFHLKSSIHLGMVLSTAMLLFSLTACDTAIGRAVGIDNEGGAIDMPSPAAVNAVYGGRGELGEPAPDEDLWTFEGGAGNTIELHMVTAPGAARNVDTFLVLNGPDGSRVAQNDDYQGYHAGMVTVLPADGEYTIIAKGYGNSVGPYELQLSFLSLAGAVQDADGGLITEPDAAGSSTTYGDIQIGQDEDIWEIPAIEGDSLIIVLDGLTSLDPTLTLMDPTGQQVAYNDDYAGRDSQVSHTALVDGVYLAVARGYGGRSTGDYNLVVTGNSDRSVFNAISEELEMAEAAIIEAEELAAAAAAAELAAAAQAAEQQALIEAEAADMAAQAAEEAERASAQADMALNTIEAAVAEGENELEELTESIDAIEAQMVLDIAQLEENSRHTEELSQSLAVIVEEEVYLYNEFVRLEGSGAPIELIQEAHDSLEITREGLRTVETLFLQAVEDEAALYSSLQMSMDAQVISHEAYEARREELFRLNQSVIDAHIESAQARFNEEERERDLAIQAQQASEAALLAAAAVARAQDAADISTLTTVIDGGYVEVSTPQHGTASIVNGEIFYTHDGSSNPLDSFSAIVEMPNGEFLEVRMSIELTYLRPNTAPIAVDDFVRLHDSVSYMDENGVGVQSELPNDGRGVFYEILDLTSNDTDAEGHNLTVTKINGFPVERINDATQPWENDLYPSGEPAGLTFHPCNSATGSFYTGLPCRESEILMMQQHPWPYTGRNSFTYTVSDGNGFSSVGTVTVDITNDWVPVIANDLSIEVAQNEHVEVLLEGLFPWQRISRLNGQDVAAAQQQILTSEGLIVITSPQSFTYTSTNNVGADVFTYEIRDLSVYNDQFADHDLGTISVAVLVGNLPPTPANITAEVEEGGTVSIPVVGSAPGITLDDLDPEGDVLNPIYGNEMPQHGVIHFDAVEDRSGGTVGWNLVYTHDGSEEPFDEFDYVLDDGYNSNVGRINIFVIPTNDVPLAFNYDLYVDRDGSASINVVNADTDGDGQLLEVALSNAPISGEVNLDGSTFVYNHDSNSGTQTGIAPGSVDYFEYSLTDGEVGHPVVGIVNVFLNPTTVDVVADLLPAPGNDREAWDPEIGIRFHSLENLNIENANSAILLQECSDITCQETSVVPGETRLLQEDSSQILSFIPDTPLYGGTMYKANLGAEAGFLLADGVTQSLSSAVGNVQSWTFETAAMTRFVLPLLISYSDSECRGSQETAIAHKSGEILCYTLDEMEEVVFGMEENQMGHFLDVMGNGNFVQSPIRNHAGHVVKSIQVDRDKPYIGGTCGRAWEEDGSKPFPACPDYDPDTTLREELDNVFDRNRYRYIYHKDGSYNLLAPYRPSREEMLDWGMDGSASDTRWHYFRNVTPIYVWGVGGPDSSPYSIIGLASPPVKTQQTSVHLSHEEKHSTWAHEIGHAYFGLPDLYYTGNPGPNKTGPLDIMGDPTLGIQPFTAWSMIKAELEEPEYLFSDSGIVDQNLELSGEGTLRVKGARNGTSSDYNVIKVPAIIERDTQNVVGHYLLELIGSDGYDAQININPETLQFSGNDTPNNVPGGIAIWKQDRSDQKVLTDVCPDFFGSDATWCSREGLFNNGNHSDPPEYYPSMPGVTAGNDDSSSNINRSPGIYTLFPWWYESQLPFDANMEAMSRLPRQIELPVLEIPPYSEQPNFGGGVRVATVTLDFTEFVEDLNANIGRLHPSLDGYKLGESASFTYSVERHDGTEEMTYRDHVREGQEQFASGTMWDEMQAYGYFRHKEIPAAVDPTGRDSETDDTGRGTAEDTEADESGRETAEDTEADDTGRETAESTEADEVTTNQSDTVHNETRTFPHEISYAGRGVTINSLNINGVSAGVGQAVHVIAGTAGNIVDVQFDYTHATYCPGCVVQFMAKVNDNSTNCLRSGQTQNGGSVTESFDFTAPDEPGIYYMQFVGSLQYSCGTGTNASTEFGTNTLATLMVYEGYGPGGTE